MDLPINNESVHTRLVKKLLVCTNNANESACYAGFADFGTFLQRGTSATFLQH